MLDTESGTSRKSIPHSGLKENGEEMMYLESERA